MKNLWIKASILAAVCTVVGCAESKDDPVVTPCTVSYCKDASTLMACTNGQASEITCPNGCSGDACITANTCTANKCQDSQTLLFCSGGIAQPIPCPFGCANDQCNPSAYQQPQQPQQPQLPQQPQATCTVSLCQDASTLLACVGGIQQPVVCPWGCENNMCKLRTEDPTLCTNGQTQCNGAIVQTCINNAWVNGNTCDYGCVNGQCNSPVCTAGTKQCVGNKVQFCAGSTWVDLETCSGTCQNGACVNTPDNPDKPDNPDNPDNPNKPVVGSSCNSETYVESCANNTAYYCKDSAVADYACSADTSCKVKTSGVADCVESCSANQNGQTGSYFCYDYYGMMMVAYPIVCSAAKDGSYGYFVDTNSYEMCDAYCSTTEGCTDTVEYSECSSSENKSYCKSNGKDLCIAENGADSYCADSCSREGAVTTVCEEYEGNYYTFYYECTKAGNILFSQMTDDYDECPNGCNAAGTACAGSSTNPSECTNGALQCNGYGVPQKCVSGKWQTQTPCTSGTYCENGVCKSSGTTQPTTPKAGDPCDASFKDVCTSSTLYYCGNDNKVVTYACSAQNGMACDTLNDGTQDCVYTNATVKSLCTKDGEQVPAFDDPCDDGIYYYLGCKLNKSGELVGIQSVALSICYDFEGTTYMLGCTQNDEEGSAVCSSSCTYNASTYQAVCK